MDKMPKRPGDFLDGNSKKRKSDKTSLWDDDLDDQSFLEIANQIPDDISNSNNDAQLPTISMPPSYESFQKMTAVCSTQLAFPRPSVFPPNSYFVNETKDKGVVDLERRLTDISLQLAEKNGEISILRSQLKEANGKLTEERNLRQSEIKERRAAATKEINAVKSELQYKNLEIVKLQEKYANISKISRSKAAKEQSTLKIEPSVSKNETVAKITSNNSDKPVNFTLAIFQQDTVCPVKLKIPSDIFKPLPEEKFISGIEHATDLTRPYLCNSFGNQEVHCSHELTAANKNVPDISDIFTEISQLMQKKLENLEDKDSIPIINKVVLVSVQLLNNFIEYLTTLGQNCNLDIDQVDALYNQIYHEEDIVNEHILDIDLENEMGIRAGRTIYLISELVSHNTYLRNYIFGKKNLDFDENIHSDFQATSMFVNEKYYYLKSIKTTVTHILSLRKSQYCVSFLCSVVNLLHYLCYFERFEKDFVNNLCCDILVNILFSKPNANIVYRILLMLKRGARNSSFLNFLCAKPSAITYSADKKIKMLYFTKDSCKFALFVSVFNVTVGKIGDEDVILNVALNVVTFVFNVFHWNPSWVHYQDKSQCECLTDLFRLTVESVHKAFHQFKETKDTCKNLDRYFNLFNTTLCVFNFFSFAWNDLCERYLTDLGKYKFLCDQLNLLQDEFEFDKQDVQSLKQLNGSEEEIPNESHTLLDDL